ncbi:hypothetical protein MYAM1_000251 [Malassezia yamatoensis]|uniref:E3 ubiquitin-protein ligase listerin n=1 Tax=Malassezia yamatoensis TaxID=253288 RepID=A0AAJ5YTZ4_9BASI|nr:hypothetical protein MYAM1_000251 [Malassezia yamatoensis]
MAKGTRKKSSATAGTRKKQAAKAAAKQGPDEATHTASKKLDGKKLSKKERQQLKKRSYVPPPKPPQPPPYPLDSMGLASLLPPSLVVILRKALKKDIVTRVRSLESFLDWIQARDENEQEDLTSEDRTNALIIMLPCWVHLLPRIALSPSQRLRLLAIQVHELLLKNASVRDELLAPATIESIIGFWAVLTQDTSRGVALLASRLWSESFTWDDDADSSLLLLNEYSPALLEHLQPILLSDSPSTNLSNSTSCLQPVAPVSDGTPSKERDAKNRDDVNVDESADELDDRLVAGALGVMAMYVLRCKDASPEQLVPFVESSIMWTSLESKETDQRCFGKDSPLVRRRAWCLLGSFDRRFPGLVEEHLSTIITHAFRGAWSERDVSVLPEIFPALLPLLKRKPNAWTITLEEFNDGDTDDGLDSESESNHESADEAQSEDDSDDAHFDSRKLSWLDGFLSWTQFAGVRAPKSCFPAVLVLLSTMPPSVLPYTSDVAIQVMQPLLALSHSIVRNGGTPDLFGWDAYVTMICECSAFLVMRIIRSEASNVGTGEMATELLTAIWDELVVGKEGESSIPHRLRLRAAREWGRCLAKVDIEIDGKSLVNGSILHVSQFLSNEALDIDFEALDAAANAFIAGLDAARAHQPPLDTLINPLLELSAKLLHRLSTMVKKGTVAALPVLSQALFSPIGQASVDLTENLGELARSSVLWDAPEQECAAFIEAFLATCRDTESIKSVWTTLFKHSQPPQFSRLSVLLRVAQSTTPDADQALQNWQSELRSYLSTEPNPPRAICLSLLAAPPTLLGEEDEKVVLAAAASQVQQDPDASCIQALGAWHTHAPKQRTELFCSNEALQRALPAIYFAGYLRHDSSARELWSSVVSAAPQLATHAMEALRNAMTSGEVATSTVLAATRAVPGDASEDQLLKVLPDKSQLEAALLLASAPVPPSLHSLDCLVPVATQNAEQEADWHNLSVTSQAYVAALEFEPSLAPKVAYCLPNLIYLAICLEDALWLQDFEKARILGGASSETEDQDTEVELRAGNHADYAPDGSWQDSTKDSIVKIVRVATRILSSLTNSLPDTWHAQAAKAIMKDGVPFDTLSTILYDLSAKACEAQAYARIFARVLSGIFSFSSASNTDMEAWIRSLDANTSCYIRGAILYVTRSASATAAHDRARNELGAALGGISPARAAITGVETLYMLKCALPPASLGLSVIPTQRAVFAMQAIQRWLASEEDLPDTLFALLPSVCADMAPVLQSVAGRMDFMMDLIEENLSAMDVSEALGWVGLDSTLSLLAMLDGFQDAEPVQKAIAEHRPSLQTVLHDTFIRLCEFFTANSVVNEMQSLCLSRLIPLVHTYVPDSAFAEDKQVYALLQSTTHAHLLQVAAHKILAQNIGEYVRKHVVELAVQPDSQPSELDPQLVHSLSRLATVTPEIWGDMESYRETFSMLLQWLTVFDHFVDASLALRSNYVSTLEQNTLPRTQLLPSIFVLLAGAPRTLPPIKPLDMNRYAIDSLELDSIDPSSAVDIQVLAAHVYFRALLHIPTQVRDWFFSVRDRQLSMQVSQVTSRFCTPLLADRELNHLRNPDALARLQDEAMSIKVLSSNEVVATYTVDEHPMEIGVRLPTDFPLHGVEIKDLKRVGVSEAQWRAWLLAVQQMLSGRNGLILDALMLFKKNAEAKFQGYEGAECAICYSIISPTDQNLQAQVPRQLSIQVGQHKRLFYLPTMPIRALSCHKKP